MVEFRDLTYPEIGDIKEAATGYHFEVYHLAAHMTRSDKDITVEADEIDRIQRAVEEYGQLDSYLPASLAAERLGNMELRDLVEYIINWAIITNIEVDGDIRYTLLPSHVVALYQDLDRHSECAAHCPPDLTGNSSYNG